MGSLYESLGAGRAQASALLGDEDVVVVAVVEDDRAVSTHGVVVRSSSDFVIVAFI